MQSRATILSESRTTPQALIPSGRLVGNVVWDAASLQPDDGFIKLDVGVIDELRKVVEVLRTNPLPIELLDPKDLDLNECIRVFARVKQILDAGVGFVIIDKLPMDEFSKEEAKAIYWLLSQLVSRPVAQSWDGKMIYDVTDLGKPPGNGVRPDVTNAEQNFHTDNSYNLCAPDYVALLCLRPAKDGGISSIVSFHTVYNEILAKHPDLLCRLFTPYLFDRNLEHAPNAPAVISHSLMHITDGQLTCRLSRRHVINGYKMACTELDALGLEALETLEATMNQRHLIREFFFEPGQIQIVDNRRLGHRRTGYSDYQELDKKRHLVRLWLRARGGRFYNG